jgi:hypothetical protein
VRDGVCVSGCGVVWCGVKVRVNRGKEGGRQMDCIHIINQGASAVCYCFDVPCVIVELGSGSVVHPRARARASPCR